MSGSSFPNAPMDHGSCRIVRSTATDRSFIEIAALDKLVRHVTLYMFCDVSSQHRRYCLLHIQLSVSPSRTD